DKSLHLAVHDDGRLPHLLQCGTNPGKDIGIRPGRRHKFDQWHKMGWVNRMNDKEPRTARRILGEGRGRYPGTRTARHSIVTHGRTYLLADGPLDIYALEHGLLYVIGTSNRVSQPGYHLDSIHHGANVIDQPELVHIREAIGDTSRCGLPDFFARIEKPDRNSRPGENHRPRRSDQATTDNGHLLQLCFHHFTFDVSPSARQISEIRSPSLVMREGKRSF